MVFRVTGGLARANQRAGKGAMGSNYINLPILRKQDFYTWALSNSEYLKLHTTWVESNYKRELTPTVDRIDSKQGYLLENMRWLTWQQNTFLGLFNRKTRSGFHGVQYEDKGRGEFTKAGVPRKVWQAVIFQNKKKIKIGRFLTPQEAARAYDRWARVVYGRTINFPDQA